MYVCDSNGMRGEIGAAYSWPSKDLSVAATPRRRIAVLGEICSIVRIKSCGTCVWSGTASCDETGAAYVRTGKDLLVAATAWFWITESGENRSILCIATCGTRVWSGGVLPGETGAS